MIRVLTEAQAKAMYCQRCEGTAEVDDEDEYDGETMPKKDCPDCYCASCGEATGQPCIAPNEGDDDLCIDCRGALLMRSEKCDKCGDYRPAAEMVSIETREDVYAWCDRCAESAAREFDYYDNPANRWDLDPRV
jgi:hypothetical protein